jgi:hypothetical protein
MSRHHHRISLLALVVCAIAVAAYSSGTKWLWLGVAPSLHLGERRSPDAARRPTLEREALKSNTVTEIREFPGRSHLMPAQQGWEEIADYALAWAEEHATHRPPAAPTSS